jgi:hypothetical protein
VILTAAPQACLHFVGVDGCHHRQNEAVAQLNGCCQDSSVRHITEARLPLRRPTTAEWMGVALLGALVLVFIAETRVGASGQFGTALRWTARWSFFWFWLASVGSALGVLFGPSFKPLATRARDFGLAFASAHSVHVGLVAYMLHSETTPFPRGALVFFGVGVFFTYLLALISLSAGLRDLLGTRTWRTIRNVGLEYINYAYFADFSTRTFHKGTAHMLVYLPFLLLTLAGPLLRLAAFIYRLRAPSVDRRTESSRLIA